MSKTEETLLLEEALKEESRTKREYGCEEVTIGFHHEGHGDEIVDYMSMDAHEVFRCYELKVTYSDLKTDNKLSWYGDYNYLVVSESMYRRPIPYDNYIPPYVGILVGKELRTVRAAKKKKIPEETRAMLKDSLLRSVYWKMLKYRDSADPAVLSQKDKEIAARDETIEEMKRTDDAMRFNCSDYETYYRKNHQNEDFTIASAARQERKEYKARQMGQLTWQQEEGVYVCPVCHGRALEREGKQILSDYCPFCGTDLRQIDK